MNEDKIAEYFHISAQELGNIIKYIIAKNKERNIENNLSSRRELLLWAMENLVCQLTANSNLKPPPQEYNTHPQCTTPWATITKNAESTREIYNLPTLAGIHFISPWLEEGRSTLAALAPAQIQKLTDSIQDQAPKTNDISSENYFLKKLLWLYFSIYSRPLSFNERLLKIVANSNENDSIKEVFILDFCSSERGDILEELSDFSDNASISAWKINFNREIFDGILGIQTKDIRSYIFNQLLPHVKPSIKERRADQILSKLQQKNPDSNSKLEEMYEALEMTWHKIIAEENSFNKWKIFLEKFKFTDNVGDSWNFKKRQHLLQALWFLQGIALYEKLVPGGLGSILMPINNKYFPTYGAFTLGVNTNEEDQENLKILLSNFISKLSESLNILISSALDDFDSDVENNNQSKLNDGSELLKREINGNKLFDKQTDNEQNIYVLFKKKVPELLNTEKAQLTIAFILQLCRKLCTATHEQNQLEFHFFVGNASELGRFREIYVFDNKEKEDIVIPKVKYWERLLKSHYSYFQQPNIGLFIEIENRVNPRVVEIMKIEQGMLAFQPHLNIFNDNPNFQNQYVITHFPHVKMKSF